MSTNDELAWAAADGDIDALEELLARCRPRIEAIARRITRNADDAQDATQRALCDVYRKIGTFEGRSSFSTWLYQVATNAALAELRNRRRHPRPVDATTPDAPPCWTGAGSDAGLPIDELVALRLAAADALLHLPAEFRATVALRHLGDLDYAAIAETLDVPIGTVRSRLNRARARPRSGPDTTPRAA